MHAVSLHWFRRKQRTFARFALAAFCLAWLQIAAMPCLMAIETASAEPMPAGMVMGPGEHCIYCPPDSSPTGMAGAAQDVCAFPQDPQVDSRIAFASAALAPPLMVVLFLPERRALVETESDRSATPAPLPRTPFAVSFCRFLK
jgi:hypothetical protein